MTYLELKRSQETRNNNFQGIFFAFNDTQFKKGMERIGLEQSQTDKIYSLGSGGFILKEKSKEYKNMIDTFWKELEEHLKDDAFLFDALYYELCNHEYCISYDTTDALECLGLTFEDLKKRENGLKIVNKAAKAAMARD